jgi:hypothetical protein
LLFVSRIKTSSKYFLPPSSDNWWLLISSVLSEIDGELNSETGNRIEDWICIVFDGTLLVRLLIYNLKYLIKYLVD